MKSIHAARPASSPTPPYTPPKDNSFWSRNTDYIVPGSILVVGIVVLIPLLKQMF
jgi:hypothetical protein